MAGIYYGTNTSGVKSIWKNKNVANAYTVVNATPTLQLGYTGFGNVIPPSTGFIVTIPPGTYITRGYYANHTAAGVCNFTLPAATNVEVLHNAVHGFLAYISIYTDGHLSAEESSTSQYARTELYRYEAKSESSADPKITDIYPVYNK